MKTEVSVEQNATLKDNAFAALFGVSPGAHSLLLVEARDGSQRASSDERFLGLRRPSTKTFGSKPVTVSSLMESS
eukprot:2842539-Prymnesium_polylepis.1